MATITATGSKNHHNFTMEITETSYSVNNNTSDISYTLKISPKQKGWDWNASGVSYAITVNGTQVASGSISKYDGSSTVTIKSASVTGIAHNNDGTKNLSFGFTITDSTSYSFTPGNASASGTLTLTTIPRASQIGVADANIGSSTNITINKNSSLFTTTLYYKASGQSSWTKIVDKTANQVYAWTVPTSFYALIPNSKTITCQFYADTYNGSTLVGTSSTVTATFTATGNPTISSFTLVDTNSTTTALTGDSSKMVRYASNVRATVSASGQNSATVSSIKVNGTTASSGVVNFSGATTNSYQAVVTDSRGYTTSQTKTMTMVNYVVLTLNATVTRNQPTDDNVNVVVSGNYFNGSFGSQSNTLTIQYRYKERTSSSWGSWTSITPTISGNTYNKTTQLSGFDYTKIYDFQVQATDKVGTKSVTGITLSKGIPIFNWDGDEFDVNVDNTKLIGNVLLGNVEVKNLINNLVYDTRTSGVAYSNNGSRSVWVDSQNKSWAWVQLSQRYIPTNTQLTFSCNFSANGYANTTVYIYDNNGNSLASSTNTTATTGKITLSFTTPTSTIKIRFSANSSGTAIQNTVSFSNLMIEEGSEATTYYEYQSVDGKQIYSTGETTVGYWFNGKPIYRRVVTFTPSTSALETSISHGISNVDEILPTSKCMLYRTSNQFVPFSMTYPDASTSILAWSMGWEANRIQIITWVGSNMRGQMDTSRGYGAIAILEYTKTTD